MDDMLRKGQLGWLQGEVNKDKRVRRKRYMTR